MKWTAPASNTYHLLPGREPHSFERCTPECLAVNRILPWIAKDTEIDTEQMIARANVQPPERPQQEP